jgi:hypothetical protein
MLIQESYHDVPTTADGQGTMRKYLLYKNLLTNVNDLRLVIVFSGILTNHRNLRLPPDNPGLPQSPFPRRSRLQRDLPR